MAPLCSHMAWELGHQPWTDRWWRVEQWQRVPQLRLLLSLPFGVAST